MTRRTYIQFCTFIQLPNESVYNYAKRFEELAENLTLPPDEMFMLSNFRAGLLDYPKLPQLVYAVRSFLRQ